MPGGGEGDPLSLEKILVVAPWAGPQGLPCSHKKAVSLGSMALLRLGHGESLLSSSQPPALLHLALLWPDASCAVIPLKDRLKP